LLNSKRACRNTVHFREVCVAIDQSSRPQPVATASHPRLILAVFTAAIFTSAFLLFAVQPMFTRMILPILGGSPAVWSVAMVFFQSMLLGGYLYAHVLMQVRRPAIGAAVHVLLLITAGLTLPLSIAKGWGEPPTAGTAIWLIGLFTVSIGLPFFALAANNPLLQAWFVRTGHAGGKDPYFLYAASNIGSFLALLSYPVLFEPTFTLRAQGLFWSGGFWLLFALIVGCGTLLLRAPASATHASDIAASAGPAPSWSLIGRWMFLAAVPSGLLVAVTAHITTDVAAAPFLWVIPLSLYLLTWVIVFQTRPLLPHGLMLKLLPAAIVGIVALLSVSQSGRLALNLGGHLLGFFVIAMASHGELARSRPAASHLTGFYVSLSAGGMIGGLFSGLIAPNVFSSVAEYPILLVLAALCGPVNSAGWSVRERAIWIFALVLLLGLAAPRLLFGWLPNDDQSDYVSYAAIGAAAVGGALMLAARPMNAAVAVAAALVTIRLYPSDEQRVYTVRSFFGVHKVYDTRDGKFRVLTHGTTIHGAQRLLSDDGTAPGKPPEPLTYYYSDSPMARTIRAVRARKGGPLNVAVIGLGSGTLACYFQPGENWRFFEIDPSIVDLARDRPRFSYIRDCAPEVPIVVGDARLTLAREPDRRFDVIVVDAYSSDAIPIHLATREAMAIYKAKLAPKGVIVMHISNRHLELDGVVAGIAHANGLKAWSFDGDEPNADDDEYRFSSSVVIAAEGPDSFSTLAADKDWKPRDPDAGVRVWTDDYSNVFGVLRLGLNWPDVAGWFKSKGNSGGSADKDD
jgi:hypothetical protein